MVAVFSEAMDPDTLNRRTVSLCRGGSEEPIRAPLTYQEERRKVVLDPVERLRPNATYKAVVAGSVRDSSGNPMTEDVAWTFMSEG